MSTRVPPSATDAVSGGWLAHPIVKPLVFLVCLLPFLHLFYGAWANALGPNPAEAVIRGSGDWALRMLCVTLAVTPLRVLVRQPVLARWRRMLGLFAFFYAALHAVAYAWLDMGFSFPSMAADIVRRPFILVGVLTFALLAILAITSPHRMVRLLGGRRWRHIHWLIYLAAPLAILHFFWMRQTKYDVGEVAVYAGIVAILLLWRLVRAADVPARRERAHPRARR